MSGWVGRVAKRKFEGELEVSVKGSAGVPVGKRTGDSESDGWLSWASTSCLVRGKFGLPKGFDWMAIRGLYGVS